jgi:hypothetical protein
VRCPRRQAGVTVPAAPAHAASWLEKQPQMRKPSSFAAPAHLPPSGHPETRVSFFILVTLPLSLSLSFLQACECLPHCLPFACPAPRCPLRLPSGQRLIVCRALVAFAAAAAAGCSADSTRLAVARLWHTGTDDKCDKRLKRKKNRKVHCGGGAVQWVVAGGR